MENSWSVSQNTKHVTTTWPSNCTPDIYPAAATAKSLQSCLILCNSSVPGILQAKTLESESESEVVQSCPTLSDPTDCSPPGSSLHGILQAKVLEWGAISFSRGSSWPRDWTLVSCIPGRHFNLWATNGIILINNYLKCKWLECPNRKTKTGQMDTKTRPLYMLSTRHPSWNKGHIQTESEGLEKDTLCK